MSNQSRVECSYANIGKLLKSSELRDGMQNIANRIATNTEGNYETDIKYMRTRVVCSVYTTDRGTIQDNLNNNTLLKGLKA